MIVISVEHDSPIRVLLLGRKTVEIEKPTLLQKLNAFFRRFSVEIPSDEYRHVASTVDPLAEHLRLVKSYLLTAIICLKMGLNEGKIVFGFSVL